VALNAIKASCARIWP